MSRESERAVFLRLYEQEFEQETQNLENELNAELKMKIEDEFHDFNICHHLHFY